jgi:hypothetical protein
MSSDSHPDVFLMTSSHGFGSRGTWNASVDFESVGCSSFPDHQRAGSRIGSLSVDFKESFEEEDFLWTWYSECLLKTKIANRLSVAGLTGFEIKVAKVTSHSRVVSEMYSEFALIGWGGVASKDSGVKITQTCPTCGMLTYSGVSNWRKLVDWGEWDGSDFFMIWPLPRYIFVTNRAVQTMKQMNLSGVSFKPLIDLDIQDDDLSPGRVSYWFSQDQLARHRIAESIQ